MKKKSKEYLKQSLIKLYSTRNQSDIVYDNEEALLIASRLVQDSFKNEDEDALQKKWKANSIPALRQADGQWVHDGEAKANLFAATFSSKHQLVDAEVNEYTNIEESSSRAQASLKHISERCRNEVEGLTRRQRYRTRSAAHSSLKGLCRRTC